MRRLALAALAAAALATLTGSPAHAASPPTAACTVPGSSTPQACNGWFTSDVTVSWTWEPAGVTQTDCDVVTVRDDTKGTAVSCRVGYGEDYFEAGEVIRRDATPPAVTGAAPERAPDAGGWFNHPVGVAFAGADATSGLAGCTGGTYGGPDTAGAAVSGTCRDVAGNIATGSFALRYDATPPAAAAAAARPPDANGWYRSPVVVSFTGADDLSGLASCDAPVTFRGPDTDGATLAGSCADAAGNRSAPATLAVRYDSTPPDAPAQVAVDAGNGRALVAWTRARAAERYEVWRAPGLGKAAQSLVFRGRGLSFRDKRVRNGVRYRYEVRSLDRAGNVAGRAVAALPQPPVFAPADGAVLRAPPLARWEDVKGARFYNAQLYLGGVKVLSTWVAEPRLRVTRRWTFAGRERSLVPGRYRLYVWPAFGTPAKPRYGKLLGRTAFVVRAR